MKVGCVMVDESPMAIYMCCIHTTILKKNTYKIQGIQHLAVPFQVAENSSNYDYGEMYQLLLQISCYREGILSQDLALPTLSTREQQASWYQLAALNTCTVQIGRPH